MNIPEQIGWKLIRDCLKTVSIINDYVEIFPIYIKKPPQQFLWILYLDLRKSRQYIFPLKKLNK